MHLAAGAQKPNIELVRYLLENAKIKQLINAENLLGLTAADISSGYYPEIKF